MKKFLIVIAAALVLILGCDLSSMLTQRSSETAEEAGAEEAEEELMDRINAAYRAGDTDEMLQLLEQTDNDSAEYYVLKEIAYIEDGSAESDEKLAELYYEAADLWPKWQHMQKMAGVAALLEGNYKAASYRLYEALLLDDGDAESWYYLGASAYYQGNYESMRSYFEEALERDLDETLQQEILWFAAQTGDVE